MIKGNLSTRKAAKICKQLSDSGVNISSPSQSDIYKAAMKSEELMETRCIETLKNEKWYITIYSQTSENDALYAFYLH